MLNWNHAEHRIDGKSIVKPGYLAFLNIEKAIGFYRNIGEGFAMGLENWTRFSDEFRKELPEKPAVMVLDLNIEETYYKIALGERFIWVKFDSLSAVPASS